MKPCIGMVTIGQAPRLDMAADFKRVWGNEVDCVERGALDGLTAEEIAAMAPGKDDYVLVTQMADGSSVQISEGAVFPLLCQKIDGLFDEGLRAVLLLCTGEFPELTTKGLLIRPQKILAHIVRSIAEGARIGVCMPSSDQLEQSKARWSLIGGDVKCVEASPYVNSDNSIKQAAQELAAWKPQIIVMDCMGYSMTMKEQLRRFCSCPVILARTAAARVMGELW